MNNQEVQPVGDGQATPEKAEKGLAKPGLTAAILANAAVVTSATGAVLFFVGSGYNRALFEEFGIHPTVLSQSAAMVVVDGFHALFLTIVEEIGRSLGQFAIGAGLAVVVVGLVLVARLSSNVRMFGGWLKTHSPTLLIWNNRLLVIAITLFAVGIALSAGKRWGKRDAERFQQHRRDAPNCYLIKGKLEKGLVLAQDSTRSILVQPTRTKLFKNDDLEHIQRCPPSPPPGTRK